MTKATKSEESSGMCGLYLTTEPIGETVPAGLMVSFHDHGDPGPGVYLPKGWRQNKALFDKLGVMIPDEAYFETLEPLSAEGFYRVTEAFHCCEKHCRLYQVGDLVQLGYRGDGTALLFLPIFTFNGLTLPKRGTRVGMDKLSMLEKLNVPEDFQEKVVRPAPSAERTLH